jgi:acetoin utilization protein AcuB
MLIRDVMTKDVITVASDTSIDEAKKIMKEHKFRRLPVVDNGKLVGLVTEDRLERFSQEIAAPSSLWQIRWLLSKTTVGHVMEKSVVTIEPESTVEQAVALAQSRGIGSLVVVKNDKVVGIATTNDLFYKIVNPTLGIGEPGTRVEIHKGGEGKAAEEIIACINKLSIGTKIIWAIPSPKTKETNLTLHLDTEDVTHVIKELQTLGYKVTVISR